MSTKGRDFFRPSPALLAQSVVTKLQHRKQILLLITQGCQLRDVHAGPSRTRPITDPGHACSPVSRDATRNASFPFRSCELLAAWESQWMVFISAAL
jgi:hypothetical protein